MENSSPIMQMIGYEPKTTFWMDFSIADRFGIDAIKDTFVRAFEEWRTNHIYLTELVMVLNHKVWYYYQSQNMPFYNVYLQLFNTADAWAMDNLKDEELTYFLTVTD